MKGFLSRGLKLSAVTGGWEGNAGEGTGGKVSSLQSNEGGRGRPLGEGTGRAFLGGCGGPLGESQEDSGWVRVNWRGFMDSNPKARRIKVASVWELSCGWEEEIRTQSGDAVGWRGSRAASGLGDRQGGEWGWQRGLGNVHPL